MFSLSVCLMRTRTNGSIIFSSPSAAYFNREGLEISNVSMPRRRGWRMKPRSSVIRDHILNYLVYDRESLKTCSLVCRAWLPSSRYHLFSDILLTNKTWPNFLSLNLFEHAHAYESFERETQERFRLREKRCDAMKGSAVVRVWDCRHL